MRAHQSCQNFNFRFQSLAAAAVVTAVASAPLSAQVQTSNSPEFDEATTVVTFDDGAGFVSADRLANVRYTMARQTTAANQVTIHGGASVGDILLPHLVSGYAAEIGADLVMETGDDGTHSLRLINADGSTHATFRIVGGASYQQDADITLIDRASTDGATGTGRMVYVGADAVTPALHPDNPVRRLSLADIAAIWAGEITNWRQLGGMDIAITRHHTDTARPDGLASAPGLTRHASEQDLLAAVAADPGAIGYVGRSLARSSAVRVPDLSDTCGLDLPASNFSLKAGIYPMIRPISLHARSVDIGAEAQAFLQWVAKPGADRFVAEAGIADRGADRMRLEDLGRTLIHSAAIPNFDAESYGEMLRTLRDAERLSVALRFRPTSVDLDEPSLRELEQLASRLRGGAHQGYEVLLAGFTDAKGGAEGNRALSAKRATAVAEQLAEMLGEAGPNITITPHGFGEQLPIACNDTAQGRDLNRRVEVWLQRASVRTTER